VRILITGGTGFLGRAVTRTLASRHDVVLFARTASQSGLPGALVDGDVRDAEALTRAAEGCDAICHMAALVSIWRPRRQEFDDVNVGGLDNAMQAAERMNIRRFVYVSSFLALPPKGQPAPIEANDYQRTKVAADRMASARIENGAPIVRVYPGVIYGPGMMTEGNLVGRLVGDHLRRRLPGLIGPDRVWSFSFVADVAQGIAAALERGVPGARYMLGGENATPQDLFAHVRRITGRKPPRRIPYGIATAIALEEETRATLFGAQPLVTRGAVEIFRHDWPVDASGAARDLGYPTTPLADGVAALLEAAGR